MFLKKATTLLKKIVYKFYPHFGWRKLFTYYKLRLMRISATPHSIALGFAIGGFISCTPLLGLHIILTVVIAWLARGSIIASLVGGVIGNPITLPIAWFTSYKIGIWLLGMKAEPSNGDPHVYERLSFSHLLDKEFSTLFYKVFTPTLLGSLVLGSIVAIVCYIPVYYAVALYQHNKKWRLSIAAHRSLNKRKTAKKNEIQLKKKDNKTSPKDTPEEKHGKEL